MGTDADRLKDLVRLIQDVKPAGAGIPYNFTPRRIRNLHPSRDFGEAPGVAPERALPKASWGPEAPSPDPDEEIQFRLEDLRFNCEEAREEPRVVLSSETIDRACESGQPVALRFVFYADSALYSAFLASGQRGDVRGSVSAVSEGETGSVEQRGSRGDQVRVIAYRASKDRGGAEQGAPATPDYEVKAFIRRAGVWRPCAVEVVDLRRSLFSRIDGLFETDALAGKRVFVAGLGSGGSTVVIELAKSAVGAFDVMDLERIKIVNVIRHLAGLSDIGRTKTDVTRCQVLEKNPYAQVRTWTRRVCWEEFDLVRRLVRESDLTIGATDDKISRYVLNKACVEEGKTAIYAAAFRRAYGGQVFVARPGKGPCYMCFLRSLPPRGQDEEVSSEEQSQRVSYSDQLAPVEPGLSTDILPISTMVVKLAILELLRGRSTALSSLEEDLIAPWYMFLNRRESETEYEALKPMAYDPNGVHVLRWYGIQLERDKDCPVCGAGLAGMLERESVEISEEDWKAFA